MKRKFRLNIVEIILMGIAVLFFLSYLYINVFGFDIYATADVSQINKLRNGNSVSQFSIIYHLPKLCVFSTFPKENISYRELRTRRVPVHIREQSRKNPFQEQFQTTN